MFTEYIKCLNSMNKEQKNKFSILDDLINFLKTINIIWISFNSLLQINKKDDDILYSICSKILSILYEDLLLKVSDEELKSNDSINNLEISDESEAESEEKEENPEFLNDNKNNEEDFDLEKNLINFKNDIDNILKENFKANSKNENFYNDYIKGKKSYKRISISNRNSIFESLYGDEDLEIASIILKKKKKK